MVEVLARPCRPIPFSAPMVKAILAGQKTQTRRVVKAEHVPIVENLLALYLNGKWDERPHPYGRVGDRLWVREAWRVGAWDSDDGTIAVEYRADGATTWPDLRKTTDEHQFERLWIQSTDDAMAAGILADGDGHYDWEPGNAPTRWRSPRFMPRWASRITLEITAIRVERLNDIGLLDVMAEGCEVRQFWLFGADKKGRDDVGRTVYSGLWNEINAKRAPWESNPLVWVIGFQRVTA